LFEQLRDDDVMKYVRHANMLMKRTRQYAVYKHTRQVLILIMDSDVETCKQDKIISYKRELILVRS